MTPDNAAPAAPGRPLQALDLVSLSRQLEADAELGWQALQARDFEIGRDCTATSAEGRLRHWLQRLHSESGEESTALLDESALGWLLAVPFLVLGVLTMTGFLWANRPDNLVNVLLFFFVFVVLQLLLCLLSAATLWAAASGRRPSALVLNPARWLVQRYLPRQARSLKYVHIVQLLALRLGQLAGVAFVSGCLLAYAIAPAVNDSLSFGWSASWITEEQGVAAAAAVISRPWSSLPGARDISEQDVGATFFESGQPLRACLGDTATAADCRGLSREIWGSFLGLSLLVYVLLPRLLLWLVARHLYRRRLSRAFVRYPGAELVLQRMQQPRVQTQGDPTGSRPQEAAPAPLEGTLLINWSDAIGAAELDQFAELRGLDGSAMVAAGLSFEQDQAALQRARLEDVRLVMLVAKSWEPPMSDLADFIGALEGDSAAVVFLRPLNGRDIPLERLDDWKTFALSLPEGTQVKALNRAGDVS